MQPNICIPAPMIYLGSQIESQPFFTPSERLKHTSSLRRTLAQEKIFLWNPNLALRFLVTMKQSIHVTIKRQFYFTHTWSCQNWPLLPKISLKLLLSRIQMHRIIIQLWFVSGLPGISWSFSWGLSRKFSKLSKSGNSGRLRTMAVLVPNRNRFADPLWLSSSKIRHGPLLGKAS